MENVRSRPVDSQEASNILEEILLRGMSPKDATVMVIDMLLAGIDTVTIIRFTFSYRVMDLHFVHL